MTQQPEQFTKILVNLSQDGNAIVVAPQDGIAKYALRLVLDNAPASFRVHSGGVTGSDEHLTGAYLNFGGESYGYATKGPRGSSSITTEYKNGVRVLFDLSNVDQSVAYTLRGYLWYGIMVDPASSIDNFRLLPSRVCKTCQKPLDRMDEMEFSTCDDCAARCEHSYVEGLGYANGHIAHMPFCKICGRIDPDWQPSDNPLEDVLQTVASGDLSLLALEHPDGSSTIITGQ